MKKVKFEIKETESDETDVEWYNWYDGDLEEGIVINTTKISFNEENEVFYLIDEGEGKGCSVFCKHHENAKYKNSTPHGMRLAGALARFFKHEAGEVESDDLINSIAEHMAEKDSLTVNVIKTDKGVLWTCS